MGLDRVAIHRPIDRGVGVKAFHVRSVPSTPGRPEPVETPWGRADDPATALVQHTMDAGTTAGVVSADAALHDGVVGEQQLREATGVVATWPRASKARAMVELVDGRSESVGESRCRVELAVHGIAATPQVEIRDHRDRFVARVDLLVDGTRVVVEFDGRVKYDWGDPAVLWAEKKREDRLRALGSRVVRITWADLETPGAVVAKVRRAMAVPA